MKNKKSWKNYFEKIKQVLFEKPPKKTFKASNFAKVMKRLIPSEWVKVDRFQSRSHLQILCFNDLLWS